MDEIETGKIKCADLPQITVHRLEDGKTYARTFFGVSVHPSHVNTCEPSITCEHANQPSPANTSEPSITCEQ
jgi:hypothetical protein